MDMSRTWKVIDDEVARFHVLYLGVFFRLLIKLIMFERIQIEATVMPEEYRYKKVLLINSFI